MTTDPLRLLAAAVALLIYVVMCLAIMLARLPKWRQRRREALSSMRNAVPSWMVAYASQTGSAEILAEQTATMLRLSGIAVRLCSLAELAVAELERTERILFVVSTYGEGDPPDNAATFFDQLIRANTPLPDLHYAILALGDRNYAHYCGFGRALSTSLQQRGAQQMFDRIDLDRGDAATLDIWRQRLSHLAGTSDLPDWNAPGFDEWTLLARRRLNPGSVGEAVFHLELAPAQGTLPDWRSGDLAQVMAPDDVAHPREYSIASLPADGRVHLLIRLHRRPDGSAGVASHWLGVGAAIGSCIMMRLRAHRRFQLEETMLTTAHPVRPLILIANGTGIAGLRSHIKARARHAAGPNWLVFGERHGAVDYHYRDEIGQWKDSGILQHVDAVFSRDQLQRRYVQDALMEASERLQKWVAQGAAIYVCGSLKGMAGDVNVALVAILGQGLVDELSTVGRYRRDVY